MRHVSFIAVLAIFVYAGISTIVADASVIGSIGESIAVTSRSLFGYVAFALYFLPLYPMYRFYRNPYVDLGRVEKALAMLLVFFSILILQAMLVQGDLRGSLGSDFVDFLHPYIGTFGLWIFWLSITAICAVMLFDLRTVADRFAERKPALPSFEDEEEIDEEQTLFVGFETPAQEDTDDAPLKDDAAPFEITEAPGLVPETHDEAENVSSEIPGVDELPGQTPAEPKQKMRTRKSTIVELSEEVKKKKGTVIVEELDENKKLLEQIETGKTEKPKNFKLPSLDFLQKPSKQSSTVDEKELDDKIRDLIAKLKHFKIEGDVIRTYAGPVVSTFEFKPAANIKVSKILNLQDDLAMALRAQTIRIQAPIPGKDVVGIEIPNRTVETIYLREIFESKLFKEAKSPLTIALGKDIVGKPFITDLKKLPHLLIAGTTGSGKSVGINAMILSLLYKNSPDQLRLLMIDPKMLEFSIYNDIPHLLTPVITKAKQAIAALANMVGEMERRYQLMSEARVKNIENYNEKMKKEGGKPFPYIVVIIDELADLMMTSGKDVEHSIARLAQMARASGIHLIVATQRPSVDVVTGLIKANLPSRISYRVGQRVDSKIILDTQGAESLLGRGDMLFTPPGATGLIRLHAPWSTEEEIEKIVEFIKVQREPQYDESFLADANAAASGGGESAGMDEMDELYEEAKQIVLSDRKTSISYLQRKLQIGYNRAARIIEQMEQRGLLSAPNAKGNREILE